MAATAVLEQQHIGIDDRVSVEASAQRLISDEMRPLVRDAVKLMIEEAAKQRIPWNCMVVRGHVDPDEGDVSINLTQHVCIPQVEADHYWESLDPAIDEWLGTLSKSSAEKVMRSIFFRVASVKAHGSV